MSTVLSDPDMVLFIEDTPQNAWIKLNLGQAGFYRTKYSPEMLQALIPAIQGQVHIYLYYVSFEFLCNTYKFEKWTLITGDPEST